MTRNGARRRHLVQGAHALEKLLRCVTALALAALLVPSAAYAQVADSSAAAQAEQAAAADDAAAQDAADATEAGAQSEDGGEAAAQDAAEAEPLAFDLAGSGTQESPYLIASTTDYQQFFTAINTDDDGTYRSAYYELTCDIDVSTLGSGYQSPIAPSSTYAFNGSFDGGGYTISGLAISASSNYQALFGYVSQANIENLSVEGTVSGKQYVAGIVGYADRSTLANLVSDVDVTSTDYSNGGGAGGVVAYARACSLHNCANTGDVTAAWTAFTSIASGSFNEVGGVVGYVYAHSSYGTCEVVNCYNKGTVSGTARIVGGVIGEVNTNASSYTIEVANCYNMGTVAYTGSTGSSYRSYTGGIIGYCFMSSSYWAALSVDNCYSAGTLSSTNSSYNAIAGIIARTPASSLTSTYLANNYYLDTSASYGICTSSTTTSYWVAESEGVVEPATSDEFTTAGFAATLGSAYADDTGTTRYNAGYPYLRWQNPDSTYEVSIVVSLANENNESADNAITVTVLDASGTDVTAQFTAADDVSSTGGTWTCASVANGSTYTYTVAKTGYETATGSIEVAKESVTESVALEPTAYSYTLTVSPADADVTFTKGGKSVSASETSTSDDGATATYVYTGLYNSDELAYSVSCFGYTKQSSDTFSLSFADSSGSVTLEALASYTVTVNVSTPDTLEADAAPQGISALDIDIDASVPDDVAELLEAEALQAAEDGDTDVPIVLLYCIDVSDDYDGSVVYNSREDADAPTGVTEGTYTYSAANMIDGTYGYVAYAYGYATASGSFAVEGADTTLDIAITAASADAWDGESVDVGWYVFSESTTDYYISSAAELAGLSALVGGAATSYDGTELDAENFEGATVHLMADIDLGGDDGVYWTPIGSWASSTSAGSSTIFAGTFDGEGHTISNMLVGSGSTTRLHSQSTSSGLFSEVAGSSSAYACVQDLCIEDATVTLDTKATAGASGGGILAGKAVYATIENVEVSGGSLSLERYYVGAVVGRACYATISDCLNSADVTATQYHVGGIVGQLGYGGGIERCGNTGTISSSYTQTTATYGLGGIVGQISSTGITVDACYNRGTVTGTMTSIGGILGSSASSAYVSISNCYNTGTIQTSSTSTATNGARVGGIAGNVAISSSYVALANCYSAATVGETEDATATYVYAGGILGYAVTKAISATTATNCYYDAEADTTLAGAIGCNYSSSNSTTIEGALEASDTSTMQSETFIETLGTDYFAADATGSAAINGGYPVLIWEDTNALWPVTLSITLDTDANDDGALATDEDGTVSYTGTLPTLSVVSEDGAVVGTSDDVQLVVTDAGIGYAFAASYELGNGTYTYSISKQGYSETQDDDGTYTSAAEGSFTVARSACTEDVELIATKYAYTVQTLNSSDAEQPLADALVSVRDGGSEGEEATATSTDSENGTYVYALYNGSYYVKASKYGYTTRETGDDELVSVSYGDTSSTIYMEQLGEYTLTIVATPDTGSFAEYKASLSLSCDDKDFDTQTVEAAGDGTVTFATDVAEGTYSYEIRAGGYAKATGSVEVDGADVTLDVTLEQQESWDGESLDISFYDEDATELHIVNADELAGLAAIVNGTATDDDGATIQDDFSGKTVYLDTSIQLGGYQWTSIGTYNGYGSVTSFAGTFDGQGNTISGFAQDLGSISSKSAGLFGAVAGATVRNLVLVGSITGTLSASKAIFPIGGFAGYSSGGVTYENCGNEVRIDASVNALAYAAGFTGWAVGGFTATGCYNKVDVNMDTTYTFAYTGGFVGYSSGQATFATCYSTGSVTATCDQEATYIYAGGLAGLVGSALVSVRNVYVTGSVSATANAAESAYVGAFVGNNTYSTSTIAYAYYLEGAASASTGEGFAGTDVSESVEASELKDEAFLSYLNDGLDAETDAVFATNSAGGYPQLSWERDVLSVEVVSLPDKTDYEDRDNFDVTGLVLRITYTNGYAIDVDSGWTVLDGTCLAVGQESVTIDYSGWTFVIAITVTQVEHETIDAIELEVAGPVLGQEASGDVTILSDTYDTYTASATWTQAGEAFEGSFAACTYYRAEVTVQTYYEDDAWWVLPEDVSVTVTAADGTPEPLEVLYATRADDGQSYTLTCTYAALDASGLTDTASHLYYAGDSEAPLYNYALDEDVALTLSVEGEEQEFTLGQLEQGALDGTYTSYEGSYSAADGSYTTYTGLKLYDFLTSTIGARAGDETAVTLVSYSGAETELALGDLRLALSSFDEDGEATSVPWLLAYGADGVPYLPSTMLLEDVGALMAVSGQASASSEGLLANVVRIEIDELEAVQTRTVTFEVTCDGEELDGSSIVVTDSFGNTITSANGRCIISADEEYTYTVTTEGYLAATGTLVAATDDETVAIEVIEVYSGSYDDEDDEPTTDEDGAYLIYTAEQLMWWADNGSASDTVILMDDIALNDGLTYDADSSNQWPLEKFGGSESSAFKGTFDGNGHTIYGFYIYRENTLEIWEYWDGSAGMISDNVSQIGMFGYATDATITNLGLEGRIEVLDRPDSMNATWMQIGGLVGYGTRVTIENCTANIGIYHTQATGSGSIAGVPYDGWPEVQDAYVGGLIGTAANSTISNCYTRGEVYTAGSRTNNAGGIAGRAYQYTSNQTVIENCYSTVTVTASPEWGSDTWPSYQGGIAGKVTSSSSSVEGPIIENCVAANASIDGGTSTYSVAYRVAGGGDVENCYGLATMTIENAATDSDAVYNGTDVSRAAVVSSALYLESALWEENTDSTVTSTSTGWQFVTDETPYLYWEDTSTLRSDDMTAQAIDPTSGAQEGSSSIVFTEYSPPLTFTINVEVEGYDEREYVTYTSKQLRSMAQTDYRKYSGYTSYAPYGRITNQYIPFEDLFEDAELPFESGDTLVMGGVSYDYDTYFGTTRYYFPEWASSTSSTDGAEEVETSLILRSYGVSMSTGTDGDAILDIYASSVDYLYAYMIVYGQTTPTESNVGTWMYQQTEATVSYDADDTANDYVSGLLADAIATAAAYLSSTSTGDTASEVTKGTSFVSAELMAELREALESARSAASSASAGTATNGDAMEAVEELEEAIAAFEAGLGTGTKGADFTSLDAAVTVGTELLEAMESGEIYLSEDGTDVPTDAQWTTVELYEQLVSALDTAAAYDGDYYIVQDDLDTAAENLLAILQAIEDSLAYGIIDLADVTAAAIDAQTYTGEALEPGVTLTAADGAVLVEGEDYTLAYADNVETGTASVTVTGIGSCTGTLTLTFEIASAELGDASVTFDSSTLTYTGDELEPAVTVTTADGTVLVEGEDYTLEYADNVDVGTATVTITGTGNYAGTLTATFTIEPSWLFPDVTDASTYYFTHVYKLANLGIITGYTSGSKAGYFGTDDTMTRAQLATIMWRIACPDDYAAYVASGYESTTATSVCSGITDGQYWTAAADWCVANGVFEGKQAKNGSRYFAASDTVTLEQLAQVLANWTKAFGAYEAADEALLDEFEDGADVSAWARASMAWAVSVDAVQGTDDGYLASTSALSRQRVATVISRCITAGLLG